MRRIVGILGTWAVMLGASSLVFGQAARPSLVDAPAKPAAVKARVAVDPRAGAEMDRLLDEWQAKSVGIETLDAKFTRTDTSVAWGDKTYFEGRALLKAPDKACLDVQRVDRGKKSFEERIICTGKEIWQYVGQGTQTFVFTLDPNAQQAALQQGPLPFLFNLDAAKLKERYELLLLKQNAQSYFVQITPRKAIDQKNFDQAILILKKETLLPEFLRLKANNGDTQDYHFTSVGRNAAVSEKNFKGVAWPGFKVIRNPDPNAQPQPIVRGARPAQGENAPAVGVKPRRNAR